MGFVILLTSTDIIVLKVSRLFPDFRVKTDFVGLQNVTVVIIETGR